MKTLPVISWVFSNIRFSFFLHLHCPFPTPCPFSFLFSPATIIRIWDGDFLRLCFLEQFYIHRKIEGKVPRCLNTSCPHTCTAFPMQGGTFVTKDAPTFLYYHHPKFTVTLNGFTLGVIRSVGLDNCSMICIHHFED